MKIMTTKNKIGWALLSILIIGFLFLMGYNIGIMQSLLVLASTGGVVGLMILAINLITD